MSYFCLWCGDILSLSENYACVSCLAVCKKQCKRCHKPYPDLRFFSHPDDKYCNTCKTATARQKIQKKAKPKIEQDIFKYLSSQIVGGGARASPTPPSSPPPNNVINHDAAVAAATPGAKPPPYFQTISSENQDFIIAERRHDSKQCIFKRLTGKRSTRGGKKKTTKAVTSHVRR